MLGFISFLALFTLPIIQAQNNNWDLRFTNGVAAQVDERIITLEELRQEIAPLIPEIRSRSRSRYEFDQNIEMVTREILQNLVDRVLIIEDFEEKGYVIPEDYLQKEYDDHITKEFNGNRTDFLNFLKIQGKSDLQFRKELKQRLIVGFMRSNMERSHTEISPQRIHEYYENNKMRFFEEEAVNIRMITITPSGYETETDMEIQIDTIMAKLDSGDDFERLAKQYSEDSQAKNGGDWGWLKRDELLPELSKVAFQMEVGEYSQPIRKSDNIFIIYVTEYRNEGVKDLEKVRIEIEQAISARLARQSAQRWLERLRQKAYIKYFLDEANRQPIENTPVEMSIGRQINENSNS